MCDDGDENTVNDMVTAGCGCAGIPAALTTVLETAVVTAGLWTPCSWCVQQALGATADDLLSLAESTYHVAGVNALSTDGDW